MSRFLDLISGKPSTQEKSVEVDQNKPVVENSTPSKRTGRKKK
jgi:hypothetical protein